MNAPETGLMINIILAGLYVGLVVSILTLWVKTIMYKKKQEKPRIPWPANLEEEKNRSHKNGESKRKEKSRENGEN